MNSNPTNQTTARTQPGTEAITLNPDYSIAPLIVAVIEHAAADARRGNNDALTWLRTEGIAWAEGIGIEADQIINQWISNGCKPPRRKPPRKRSQLYPA